jgi:hypothetical protein
MIKGAVAGAAFAGLALVVYEYFIRRTGDVELGRSNRVAIVGAGAIVGAIFVRP